MKSRSIITAIAVLALLMLPSAASAATNPCTVGIMNEVSVVPPATLAEGDVQTHHFTISACTSARTITTEWVRVIDSARPFMLDSSNRVTVIPERTTGTSQLPDTIVPGGQAVHHYDGRDSWTIPVGQADGHYAVITRYYSSADPSGAEAQAASSFSLATPDVCSNIAGKQRTVPAGLVLDGTECVTDVCDNVAGVQRTVPTDLVPSGSSCFRDVCDNVTGLQVTVPANLVLSGTSCFKDVCDNVIGLQITVPVGLVEQGGSCFKDVCDNITGLQITVPVSLTLVGGSCIKDVCDKITGIQIAVPDGFTYDGTTCTLIPPPVVIIDTCPNLDGAQDIVPDGYTLIAGECKIVATPTGTTPKILPPKPRIVKTANVKRTVTGGIVKYTIVVGNSGPSTLKGTVTCDKLPSGTTFVAASKGFAFNTGSVCWKTGDIAKGAHKTVTLTVKVSASFHGSTLTNTACMTSTNAKKVCSTAKVKVTVHRPEPIGGVTG